MSDKKPNIAPKKGDPNRTTPNITPQNGKGDSNRTTNLKKFQENYKKIKWQSPSGNLQNTKSGQQE